MHVLFVTSYSYPPQPTGGAELTFHALAQALRARGHAASVAAGLYPYDLRGIAYRIARKIAPAGSWRGDLACGYRVMRGWDMREWVPAAIATERPDLVVVHPDAAILGALRAAERSAPILIYFQDLESVERFDFAAWRATCRYAANSRYTAEAAERLGGVGCAVLPPLVRREDFVVDSSRELATFVNPRPHKGAAIAFALARARPRIRFLFVYPTLADWLQQRRSHGWHYPPNIVDRVRVRDMRRVYRRTRLVLMPSQWRETWGRIVTEGQFSGIPAIASARAGLPEAVGVGGVLVEDYANPDAWLAALDRVWDDATLYRGLSEQALAHAARREISEDRLVATLIGKEG